MMLDPRLNHAVAVARLASFTKAAAHVGITQSAITRSIADLERELGYALFHRTARGALVTDEGRTFVEGATRLLQDTRDLFDRGAPTSPYAGILRIGICPASLEWLLVRPLAQLLRDHPDIRFDIIGGKFEAIVLQLRGGTIDVAVGFDAAFADWVDVRREPIADFAATMFVRRGHPLLQAAATIEKRDLAEFTFVSPSDSRPYGEMVRNIYEEQGKDTAKYLHVADYFPIIRQIVATSDAISAVSETFFENSTMACEFVALPNLEILAPQAMCCAVRARWDPKPAVRAFIALMQQALPPPR